MNSHFKKRIYKIKERIGANFAGSFVKGVFMMAGGTALAQFVNGVLSPIITRLYTPEEFGVLAIYMSIMGMLLVVGALHYEKAIPLADDDEKAINVVASSLLIFSMFSLVLMIVFLLYGDSILNLFDAHALINYRLLIPFGILISGVYNVFIQWNLRKRDYNGIAKTKISQSIVGNLLKIGLGLLKAGPIGLMLGTISGQSVGISTLLRPLLKERHLIKKVSIRGMRYILKRYIRFPLYSSPGEFVYAAGNNLPVLFIANIFGKEVLGYYALANLIIRIPIGLLGESLSQVVYAEAANIGKRDPKRIKTLAMKSMKQLSVLGLIPLFIILFFGPFLFSNVFGGIWFESGVHAQILAPLVFANLIITPIGRIFEIFEKQSTGFFLNILRLFLMLIVFYVAKSLNLSFYVTLGLYVFFMTLSYLALFLFVSKILDTEIKNAAASANAESLKIDEEGKK